MSLVWSRIPSRCSLCPRLRPEVLPAPCSRQTEREKRLNMQEWNTKPKKFSFTERGHAQNHRDTAAPPHINTLKNMYSLVVPVFSHTYLHIHRAINKKKEKRQRLAAPTRSVRERVSPLGPDGRVLLSVPPVQTVSHPRVFPSRVTVRAHGLLPCSICWC